MKNPNQIELIVKITFDSPVIAEDVVCQRVADAIKNAVTDGHGIAPDDEEAYTTEIFAMVMDNRDTATIRTIWGETKPMRSHDHD